MPCRRGLLLRLFPLYPLFQSGLFSLICPWFREKLSLTMLDNSLICWLFPSLFPHHPMHSPKSLTGVLFTTEPTPVKLSDLICQELYLTYPQKVTSFCDLLLRFVAPFLDCMIGDNPLVSEGKLGNVLLLTPLFAIIKKGKSIWEMIS